MKSGAGADPFADEDEANESDVAVQDPIEPEFQDEDQEDGSRELPYLYARDNVKDERSQTPMFIQEDTEDGLGELQRDLEDMLSDDRVYKTDVVEAALLVGIQNPDETAAILRDWGYDY